MGPLGYGRKAVALCVRVVGDFTNKKALAKGQGF